MGLSGRIDAHQLMERAQPPVMCSRRDTDQGGLYEPISLINADFLKITQFDIISHKNPKKYVEGIFLG